MSNMGKVTSFVIRKAILKDMAEVFQMIRELSDFQKMGNKLKIDQKTLEADYAENSSAFQCVVAENADKCLVGYAVYCQIYSTWDGWSVHLEDLYVKPQQRGESVGKQLFVTVMKNAYEAGCKKAYWYCLSWNPAVDFYKSQGAVDITEKEEFHIFHLEKEDLKKLSN